MLVIGLDPGVHTGMCVLNTDTAVVRTATLSKEMLNPIDFVVGLLNNGFISEEHDLFIVVEQAVLSGRLNQDKVEQIKSLALIESTIQSLFSLSVDKSDDIPPFNFDAVFISPEMRKHIEVKVPKGFKTNHEKDAFLQAVAGLVTHKGFTHIAEVEIKDVDFICAND